jgi:hypothetical protein
MASERFRKNPDEPETSGSQRSGTAQLFRSVDATTWPLVGETGWQLRYAPDAVNRLHAASIVSAYAHLTDPALPQREAIEALRRARQAVKEAA